MKVQAPAPSYLLGVAEAVATPASAERTPPRTRSSRALAWPWRAWLTLIALPVALLVALLARYGVSTPHFDAWVSLAPLFEKYEAGTLGVSDFFAPNNEHRLVIPKLVFFVSALLTQWNTRVESGLIVLVLVGVSACGWHLLRVTGWRDTPAARGVFVFLAALIFSTVQVENLIWGFQLHFILSLLCFSALCSLAWALPAPRNFLAAMLLAAAATYSMASGFLCWLLAVPVLWTAGGRAERKWWAIYAVAAAATIGAWMAGFERPAHHPSLGTVLEHPWKGALYFAAYLGGPFAHGLAFPAHTAAPWLGALLLVGAILALVGLWGARKDERLIARAMPWLMLATFGLATAAITAVGRAGFGATQALESRYSTYALLLPLGLVPIGALLVARRPRRAAALPRMGLVGAASVALLLLWLAQVQQFPRWATWRRTMRLEQAMVQTVRWVKEPYTLRRYVTPDPLGFPGSVAALDRLGWLHPRPLAEPTLASIADVSSPGAPGFGAVQRQQQEGENCLLYGWAFLPEAMEPAHAVLLTYDDPARGPILFSLVRLGIEREDLAKATGEPLFLHSGWATEFPRAKLPPGPQVVKAWAYDAQQGRAWRLKGELAVAP
jgi:hypothetical protein